VIVKLLGEAEREKFGAGARITVRAIAVELVKPPEVPVMVTVAVPVVAVLLAASVNVLVAVAGLGLNDAVTPLGSPEADRLTLPLKPFCAVTAIVLVLLAPCTIVMLLGEAEREKFGAGARFTVRPIAVVFVKLPDVPVMVTVAVPVVAVLLAVSVTVPVLVVLPGLNKAVTPLGSPEADRLTLPLKPFCGVTVIVLAPLVPCTIVTLLGEAKSAKLGAGVGAVTTDTLSKVAVARAVVLPLVAANPTYTVCPMLIVWLVPSCTQFTPSEDV
jgi:hypothetical protein